MHPGRSSLIRRHSDVRFRRVKDEWVVVRQTAGEVLVLNEWAGRVLELLDGSRTLQDVVNVLADEYEASAETMEKDVIAFASDVIEAGLCETLGGDANR